MKDTIGYLGACSQLQCLWCMIQKYNVIQSCGLKYNQSTLRNSPFLPRLRPGSRGHITLRDASNSNLSGFSLLSGTRFLRRRRTTKYNDRRVVVISKRRLPCISALSRILEHPKKFVSLCDLRRCIIVEADVLKRGSFDSLLR